MAISFQPPYSWPTNVNKYLFYGGRDWPNIYSAELHSLHWIWGPTIEPLICQWWEASGQSATNDRLLTSHRKWGKPDKNHFRRIRFRLMLLLNFCFGRTRHWPTVSSHGPRQLWKPCENLCKSCYYLVTILWKSCNSCENLVKISLSEPYTRPVKISLFGFPAIDNSIVETKLIKSSLRVEIADLLFQ